MRQHAIAPVADARKPLQGIEASVHPYAFKRGPAMEIKLWRLDGYSERECWEVVKAVEALLKMRIAATIGETTRIG